MAEKEKFKKQFIHAYASLCKERPDKELKVVEICTKAGIPRSTFYYSYKGKTQFLRIIEEELSESMAEIAYEGITMQMLNHPVLFCRTVRIWIESNEDTIAILQKELGKGVLKEHLIDAWVTLVSQSDMLGETREEIRCRFLFLVDAVDYWYRERTHVYDTIIRRRLRSNYYAKLQEWRQMFKMPEDDDKTGEEWEEDEMKIVFTMGNSDHMMEHERLVSACCAMNSDVIRCCVGKEPAGVQLKAIDDVCRLYKAQTDKKPWIMMDVPVPKDKNRIFCKEDLVLQIGERIILTDKKENIGNANIPCIETDAKLQKLTEEDTLIVGDNAARLIVLEVKDEHTVICQSEVRNARLSSGQGIASKKGFFKETDKDIYQKCEYIIESVKPEILVFSEIETADDILRMKREMTTSDYHPIIMAKIETFAGVVNREEIVRASDEIMIARGCLGVNVGVENLLHAQRKIIEECRKQNKKVCAASNLLRTIKDSDVPTRSDVLDILWLMEEGVNYFVFTDSTARTEKNQNLIVYLRKIQQAAEMDCFEGDRQ